MPVTKTAKRALKSAQRKELVNKLIKSQLEIAIRKAQKSRSTKDVARASSLADRAAKKKTIHKNKASRIKSQLAKLLTQAKKSTKKTTKKKTK